MRILHLNIRATQGGAGRVALDLHRRLQRKGLDSRYLYGYASRIKDDALVAGDPTIERIGTRPSVLTNFVAHRLVGRDISTGRADVLREAIEWADVVHLHCPHHYYMSWPHFIDLVTRAGKPVLATAHDWWFITGRCGFIESCTGWQRACGECGEMRHRDLPSLFDFSRHYRAEKLESIRSLGSAMRFACPSEHIANDYRSVYPTVAIDVVPNTYDLAFEEALDTVERPAARSGMVCSASDLSSPGKVDQGFFERVLAETGVPISFVGRNSPFSGPNAINRGEIRGRDELARVLLAAKGLIFTSRMDNAPLTLMEALAAGCYVVAYPSPAAAEMLRRVGGRCVRDQDEAIEIIRNDAAASLFGGVDHAGLEARARAEFAGSVIIDRYTDLYRAAVSGASAGRAEDKAVRAEASR